MWNFLSQGLNLCHSGDKAGSLTARPPGNSRGMLFQQDGEESLLHLKCRLGASESFSENPMGLRPFYPQPHSSQTQALRGKGSLPLILLCSPHLHLTLTSSLPGRPTEAGKDRNPPEGKQGVCACAGVCVGGHLIDAVGHLQAQVSDRCTMRIN